MTFLSADPPGQTRARRVAVVANGAAGALIANPQAGATLAEQFAAAGLGAEFIAPDAGTLPERLAAAIALGADIVAVAGGDGTVACAAQHLLGTQATLGILPFGTMNLLAKDLGIPVGDTAAAIRVLATGAPRAIDVGAVGDQVFLCASMLGLPTRLARHRERGRRGNRVLGWGRFAIAAIRALLRGGRMTLAIQTEAGEQRVRAQSVTVTVNPITAGAGRPFGRERLDGGEFGVYVVERLRLRDLPRLAWRAMSGRIGADSSVQESRAEKLVIGRRRQTMRVMNDGEVRLMRPPLRYRLLPGALRVMAPADAP